MTRTPKAWFVGLAAVLFCATSIAFAQEKQIKEEPIRPTSPASGAEMYQAYCAVCHGKTGEGNGPAASALKVPPANLTLLAKNNKGKYPIDRVMSILRFGTAEPTAHGTSKMPIWGPLFSSLHPSTMRGPQSAEVSMRITNLARYIESLQKK
jgi:mono/diheme cytochrome c family protein